MEFVSDLVRKLKPHMAEMINGLVTGAVKFALLHVDGDVLIKGTARRLTANLSDANFANRFLFKNSLDATSSVGVLGGGAARGSNYTAFFGTDPTNTHFVSLVVGAADVSVMSFNYGSGTLKPLRLKVGTNTYFEIDASGNITLSPVNRLKISNVIAPSDTPSGGGYLFVENGVLKYKGSSGTVTTIAAA